VSRSASARGAALAAAAAVVAVVAVVAAPFGAARTVAAPSTTVLTVPPAVDPHSVPNPVAPVLDIDAPTLDVVAPVASLDESVTEAQIGQQEQITLRTDVLFAFNKADLTPAATGRLAQVAATVRQRARGRVQIDGYTDAIGSPAYNQGLSVRRANAVQAALARLLPGAGLQLVAAGHGEADPVAANTRPDGSDNPAGRAKNRRVTITFRAAGA
jgi:outer membrane protein OmpA-like peptidoglycan-associated protein